MANNHNLKPVQSVKEARERGRRGGLASGAARRQKRDFRATVLVILDSPMEELNGICPRVAIVKALAVKAASGDVASATWLRDTAGEKPTDKVNIAGREQGLVIRWCEDEQKAEEGGA